MTRVCLGRGKNRGTDSQSTPCLFYDQMWGTPRLVFPVFTDKYMGHVNDSFCLIVCLFVFATGSPSVAQDVYKFLLRTGVASVSTMPSYLDNVPESLF